MKIISKLTVSLFTATLLFVGCGEGSKPVKPAKAEVIKPTITAESLSLRKKDITDEKIVVPRKTAYSTTDAGSGHKIKRAFQDAPPMIPHDTTGMLPIKINNNQCIGCHMPEVAASVGATSIPVSHFTNFRPDTEIGSNGELEKNGRKIKNTSSEELKNVSIKSTGDKLYGGRFNCSQCHAPQSDTELATPNTFEADYTAKDGASKSTWSGTKLMDGINTFESSK